MSAGARKVAEFVLARPEDVAMLPAAQVAERLGVSVSTVIRFAILLGYGGYPEFRRDLQAELRRHLAPLQRLELAKGSRHGERASFKAFQHDIESILRTQRDLTLVDMENAVSLISNARTIRVVGLRSSYGVAHAFGYQLNQMLGNVSIFNTAHGESTEQLRGVGPQDLVLCVSFPRHPAATVEAVRYARSRHAKIIAVTDGPMSPIAPEADVLLTVNTSVVNVTTSMTSCMSLLNAISSEVLLTNRTRVSRNFAALEEAMAQAKVHFHD